MQRGANLNCAVRHNATNEFWRRLPVLLIVLAGFAATQPAFAQEPPQRQIRTFIPPDQIVSFLPTTPFATFLDNINPIFVQVTGKRVIDPENREFQIGVSVVGMQFFDAFELVLDAHNLTYRETDRYFLIENAPEEQPMILGAEQQKKAGATGRGGTRRSDRPVTRNRDRSRAVRDQPIENGPVGDRLDAVSRPPGSSAVVVVALFQPVRRATVSARAEFFIKTRDLFNNADGWLAGPDYLNARQLNQFFRLTEAEGLGHTVASPKVSVTSGQKGRIQIGSDIPVQVRDFAGNTITQFVQTGIIIDVTPTLITSPVADTAGAPTLDFIHLDVKVERSQGRPSFGGLAIDRSTADTDVLLLDKEMTVIGGLYQTDESIDRAGIPVLKDLPWWVFGLRYIFGKETKVTTRRELLIVLKAQLLDSLPQRAESPFKNDLHLRSREDVMDILERFDPRLPDQWPDVLRPETLDKDAKIDSKDDGQQ